MSRGFYYVRVSVLSLVLAGLLLYAAYDRARRNARKDWERPLSVALVFLQDGPPVAPAALDRLRERVHALEQVLEAEFARYGGDFRPIVFRQLGPVPELRPPPVPAADPSLWHSLWLSLELRAFAREHDRAAGLSGAFDGKIYVRLSAPRSQRRSLVEGLGEDGGLIAVTSLELREDSADFGLFVVAHELFHLLGASDRYGPDGLAQLPDGLGDPGLVPRFPQHRAEVMARGRVLEPGVELPPAQLDELAVGSRTALEIGWLSAGSSR